jgi:PAS domain-containing protein
MLLIRASADGQIRYWSGGAAALYGYSEDEALGSISYERLRTQSPGPLSEIEAISPLAWGVAGSSLDHYDAWRRSRRQSCY